MTFNEKKIVVEEQTGALAARSETAALPRRLELLPMADLNVFPHLLYPISISEPGTLASLKRNLAPGSVLALFAVKDPEADPETLTEDDFQSIGMAALVRKIWSAEDGSLKALVQGLGRLKMQSLENGGRQIVAEAIAEPESGEELRPLALEARRLFSQVAELSAQLPFDPLRFDASLTEKPGLMADLMVAALPLPRRVKAEFLAAIDPQERLMMLIKKLTEELSNLEAGQAISARVRQQMDQKQRENHLREQLKAIEAELYEEGAEEDELASLAKRIESAELTPEAREAAQRELKKLRRVNPSSADYGVSRSYLDFILELPWLKSSTDNLDLDSARQLLDREHFGLEKVKKRLVEFVAVRQLTGGAKSPLLCLVGPPGVGKTSLGRSVAEALGRRFVRLSLGGVRDEAEIRGHRRTYVGALPGRILAGFKKAGVNNPVFLLDEVDKLAYGVMGDPAAALLEPEADGPQAALISGPAESMASLSLAA